MSGLLLILTLTCAGGPARGTAADNDSARIEEVRREVKALRGELQALRLSLAELAELDRQRALAITRMLDARAPKLAAAEEPEMVEIKQPPAPPPSPPAAAAPVRVRVAAKVAEAARSDSGESRGTISGRVEVPSGEPVAYVYVENVAAPAIKGESVVIEQSKKQFSPTWAVIQKGTTVKFPNLDNVYHNVFSRSRGNSFDLGLYNSSDEAKSHTFYSPGPVDVYCNIHPRMSASVLVVPSRHFVKVKPDGTFELADVPAGKRKVVAWAPNSNPQSQWVQLGGGDHAQVALTLEPKANVHKNKEGRPYTSYE